MNRARFYAVGFTVLAAFDTWTQVAFKLAARRTGPFALDVAWLHAAALNPWIFGAILGYLGSFVSWMTLLEHAPVGPAFAASHADVVTVLIFSAVLFGEHLTPARMGGAACIVAGIVLLSLSESKHAHA